MVTKIITSSETVYVKVHVYKYHLNYRTNFAFSMEIKYMYYIYNPTKRYLFYFKQHYTTTSNFNLEDNIIAHKSTVNHY